jgi:hypothetical protein
MDTYELADLMELSPAERPTLSCVKVHGQTCGTLVGLATQRGARLCTKSCRTTSFESQNGHTAARAAITLSLMLLGEGSSAEQMRYSGKNITTARQDKLDKLCEGINFAFSRHFVNIGNSHAALCSPLVS